MSYFHICSLGTIDFALISYIGNTYRKSPLLASINRISDYIKQNLFQCSYWNEKM